MPFGLLGPLLLIDDDGAQVQLAASRQRVLTAALLLHANLRVPTIPSVQAKRVNLGRGRRGLCGLRREV
jgi:hypothetical protein